MRKKKTKRTTWPPPWARLPSLAKLRAFSRGEAVTLPPRPDPREILGPALAARLPRKYDRDGPC
jgi:hypothetical protein